MCKYVRINGWHNHTNSQVVAILKTISGIMANPGKRKPTSRGTTDSTKKAKAVGSRGRGSPKEVATYRGSEEDSDGFGFDEDDNNHRFLFI